MPENMPKCRDRQCPRSDVILAHEVSVENVKHELVFICRTCKTVMVRSLPAAWDRAAYTRALREGRTFRTSYDKQKLIFA